MDEVRRLIALLVVALVGATVFGLSNGSSGLGVNGARVSGSTFRSELTTISTTPILQCYLTALDPVDFGGGGGSQTMAATGVAAWTRLRIEGLSITQYVKSRLKFVATAATLAQAETSLESELTQAASAATSKDGACPGTASAALAAMPTEMRNAEIESQAASLYLVSKLNSTIPLTAKSLEAFYTSHTSDYDTLCVSIAVVPLSQTTAFTTAQSGGESVANLAKQFSIDTSKTKGGAAGCFPPSNASYASVRSDVLSTALNTFNTTPLYINDNGTEEALFVAPTQRTVTPFAQAESAVLADVQNQNASEANTEEEYILSKAAIEVDPAFGQWAIESTGPTVLVPSLPAKVDVTGNKSLTTSVITYH
jgi:hypothetical protein